MNARVQGVANHPNRSRKTARPGANPTTAEVVAARARAGLTQEEFGALAFKGYRAVQEWEAGKRMPPDTWQLIQIKLKAWDLVKRGRIAPQAVLDLGLDLPPAEPEKE